MGTGMGLMFAAMGLPLARPHETGQGRRGERDSGAGSHSSHSLCNIANAMIDIRSDDASDDAQGRPVERSELLPANKPDKEEDDRVGRKRKT